MSTERGKTASAAMADALVEIRLAVEGTRGAHEMPRDAALARLRPVIRALSIAARDEELPPERLLVDLKRALANLPEVNELDADARDRVQGQLVLLAIREYFGEGMPPR